MKLIFGIFSILTIHILSVSAGLNIKGQLKEHQFYLDDKILDQSTAKKLQKHKSLLIMIPGVNSGNIQTSLSLLESIRIKVNIESICFYDWEKNDPGRRIASPLSTQNGAKHLSRFLKTLPTDMLISIIAHSSGSIIVNKTTAILKQNKDTIRFRNILFLGTAIDTNQDLNILQSYSHRVLNLHSNYDKINHNINDGNGVLKSLKRPIGINQEMSTSLSGRLIRHKNFLDDHPELINLYSYFIKFGKHLYTEASEELDPATSFQSSIFQFKTTGEGLENLRKSYKKHLHSKMPKIQTLAIIASGITKDNQASNYLTTKLKLNAPLYLRQEIYQALANFENKQYVNFFKNQRKNDEECSELIRDILRDYKRKRIR